jgi:hydroxymethylpyrimidine pyrophosphatase-like HAD family hydrolase
MNRPKTIFCDIDGTLIKHNNFKDIMDDNVETVVLEGTIDKLIEWDRKGYNLILVTGRRESMRKKTEKQLAEAGITYDKLIMGIGGGQRIIINDLKPKISEQHYPTALSINLVRNNGIKDIDI